MSKNNNLSNNNGDEKENLTTKDNSINNLKSENDLVRNVNSDEIINIELYNQILSTLFNSLSNPVIRNEIKVNEDILKYLELQISNLFFLETALAKKLEAQKMAKEFLQLTANITNLPLSVNKSPKKTRIGILEDRNLLIVTIVNSCKSIERETLEKSCVVDLTTLQDLSNQIAALSDFTTEETIKNQQDNNFVANESENNQSNLLNNVNINNLNNNMANLIKLGIVPEHPARNPNFYPYLTKLKVMPKLKKILSAMLITLAFFVIITIISTLFVKGSLLIDVTKEEKVFALSQTTVWPLFIMFIFSYSYFAFNLLKPPKILREKYHISSFFLGLILCSLAATTFYFFWIVTDTSYSYFFTTINVKKDNLNPNIVEDLKHLPNFKVFKIFSLITGSISLLPLIFTGILILINPRLDRNKVVKANSEYQNALIAASKGQKYDIDPTLFDDNQVEPKKRKPKKAHFSKNL